MILRVELRDLGQVDYIGTMATDDVVAVAESFFYLRDATTQRHFDGCTLLTIIYLDVVGVRFGVDQVRRAQVERLFGGTLDVDGVVVLLQDRATARADLHFGVRRLVEGALTFLQNTVQVHGILQLALVVLTAVIVAPVEADDERTTAYRAENLKNAAPRKVVVDALAASPLVQYQRNGQCQERDVDELEIAIAFIHVTLPAADAVGQTENVTYDQFGDDAHAGDSQTHADEQHPSYVTHLAQAEGLEEEEK